MPNQSLQAKNALGSSKLTSELIDVFCRLVSAGNYYIAACKAIGVAYGTFRTWMAYGKAASDSDNIYRQLYLRVQEADAYAEAHAVVSWRNQFSRDYRASRDFLARRYPDRWGMQSRITLGVDNELQQILKVLETRLSPDIYGQVIVALAGARDEITMSHEDGEDILDDNFGSVEELMPNWNNQDASEEENML